MEALRMDRALAPVGPERTSVRREVDPTEAAGHAAGPQRGPEHAPPASRETSETRPAREEDPNERSVRTEERREAARELQEKLQARERHDLQIRYSEEDDRFVVRFLDAENGEVVRQIPAEAILAANQRLDELRGLLFDEKS